MIEIIDQHTTVGEGIMEETELLTPDNTYITIPNKAVRSAGTQPVSYPPTGETKPGTFRSRA